MKYESKFEEKIANLLKKKGAKFTYESETWKYEKKPYNARCLDCGSNKVMETRDYTPDFFLSNGIVVEAKGKFLPSMRTKLLAVRESNPDRDLRIVFMRDNFLTERKKKTYTGWAKQKGFKCAVGEIPDEWLKEV